VSWCSPAVPALAGHGLEGRFVTLQTSDRASGKPSPDMVLRALAETGADAASTVVVGDTTFDMMMARNAGALAVGVTWGYHRADELRASGAHAIVSSFLDVAPTLARLVDGGGHERPDPSVGVRWDRHGDSSANETGAQKDLSGGGRFAER